MNERTAILGAGVVAIGYLYVTQSGGADSRTVNQSVGESQYTFEGTSTEPVQTETSDATVMDKVTPWGTGGDESSDVAYQLGFEGKDLGIDPEGGIL